MAKKKSGTSRRAQRKAASKEAMRQTKKQVALGRKEARQRRIIMLSVAALVAVILIIIAVAVVQELIIKPSQPVAKVNGMAIPVKDFQNLLTYKRYNLHLTARNLQDTISQMDPTQQGSDFLTSFYQQQLSQVQTDLTLAAENALEELIEDQLIAEKAQEMGITVTAAEIQNAIFPPPPEPITDTAEVPTPIPQEELEKRYDDLLSTLGMSDEDFREIVRRGLLREKLQEELAKQVPTTGLVARVQIIQTNSEEEAQAAQARIEGGEDFAIVAQEVSSDTLTAGEGGDLGWVTPDQVSVRYGPEVEDAVFSAEIGQLTLVESGGKYYLIQVLERDENGPLPEDALTMAQNSALANWLAERKNAPDVTIERFLQPDQVPPDPFLTPTAP